MQAPLEDIDNYPSGTQNTSRAYSDIIDRGVALCGGTSLMKGLDKYLTVALDIPAYVVENPVTCTVEGLARAFPILDVILRSQSR